MADIHRFQKRYQTVVLGIWKSSLGQEDKEALFDTVDTLKASLDCFSEMIQTIQLKPDVIAKALEKGYLAATDLADYLAKKGLPFRTAHEITGQIVLYAIEKNKTLSELPLEEFVSFCSQIDKGIYHFLALETCISGKNSVGGTAGARVLEQLQRHKEKYQW